MKPIRYILPLAAAMALLASGCRKEIVSGEGATGGEGVSTPATASMRVTFASGSGSESGDDGTRIFYDFRIYVFDAEDGVLEQVFEKRLSEAGSVTPASETYTVGVGRKKVVALVNFATFVGYPDVRIGITTLDDLLAATAAVRAPEISDTKYSQGIYDLTGPGQWKFCMASSVQEIEIKEPSDAAAAAQELSLSVARLVARVELNLDPDNSYRKDTGYFLVEPSQYTVKQMPRKSFCIYREAEGAWSTPDFSDGGTADLYFDGPCIKHSSKGTMNPGYLTESRHAKPMTGNSTYLLLESNFLPDVLYDKDDANPCYRNTGWQSYWSQEASPTNHADQKGDKILDTGELQREGRGFYIFRRPGELGLAYPHYFREKPSEKTAEEVKQECGAECEIIFFPQCWSRHVIWMGDFSKQEEADRYAVSRKKCYRIRISAINGPGYSADDTPVTPDEELKTDREIEYTVEVLDWQDAQVDVEL